MSSLWTPSGEHRPSDDSPADAGGDAPRAAAPPGAAPPADDGRPDDAALQEEMHRIRSELSGTPVADLIANHAIGLWQLAVLHLTPDEGEPRLDEARLAIDAMAALVDGLGDRLGESAPPLRDALAQLRMAYVQVTGRANDASTRD